MRSSRNSSERNFSFRVLLGASSLSCFKLRLTVYNLHSQIYRQPKSFKGVFKQRVWWPPVWVKHVCFENESGFWAGEVWRQRQEESPRSSAKPKWDQRRGQHSRTSDVDSPDLCWKLGTLLWNLKYFGRIRSCIYIGKLFIRCYFSYSHSFTLWFIYLIFQFPWMYIVDTHTVYKIFMYR